MPLPIVEGLSVVGGVALTAQRRVSGGRLV
jgi:hypothetical protein